MWVLCFFCAFHETKLLSQVLNSFSADLCARVPHTRWVGLRGEDRGGGGVLGVTYDHVCMCGCALVCWVCAWVRVRLLCKRAVFFYALLISLFAAHCCRCCFFVTAFGPLLRFAFWFFTLLTSIYQEHGCVCVCVFSINSHAFWLLAF